MPTFRCLVEISNYSSNSVDQVKSISLAVYKMCSHNKCTCISWSFVLTQRRMTVSLAWEVDLQFWWLLLPNMVIAEFSSIQYVQNTTLSQPRPHGTVTRHAWIVAMWLVSHAHLSFLLASVFQMVSISHSPATPYSWWSSQDQKDLLWVFPSLSLRWISSWNSFGWRGRGGRGGGEGGGGEEGGGGCLLLYILVSIVLAAAAGCDGNGRPQEGVISIMVPGNFKCICVRHARLT